MPLQPGTTLGPYTVTAKIGEGGMGEVYRARDTKLDRDVALKVLPEAFTSDPDRLARFEREAKVLASLNHPNIGSIYGLEDADGQKALVLELIEGPTLADRIKQGPIPVDEALPIATQIAEALEAAHEQGIIHRDLKPANVKVKDDGTVKVLDFGLAKALAGDAQSDPSESPTLTAAATRAGVIMGTAAYMSPEQARGKPLDRRTDVWAFGCVFYEMLTARRAFPGDNLSEVIAGVMKSEPDWNAVPSQVAPLLQSFLRRCLAKDPKQRIRDIGDVSLVLEGAFEAGELRTAESAAAPQLSVWRRVLPVAVALLFGGFGMWALMRPAPQPPAPLVRFSIPLATDDTFSYSGRHVVAVSPAGTHVVYTVNRGLSLRPVDRLQATPVSGTEAEARSPFFSPDGQQIGFYAAGQLQRVSISGGASVTLAEADNPWGASWGADDRILYGQGPQGIWRVPATGGTPEQVISVEDGEQAHGPHLLPGGEWVLFTWRPAGASWDQAQIVLHSLATDERIMLIDGGRDARYVPTGHLVYGLNGVLLAVPFDVVTRRVTGGPVPLVDGVLDAGATSGAVQFGIAATGLLVYVPGTAGAALGLVWVDRDGQEEAISVESQEYRSPRVSPDGTRLAVQIDGPDNTDIWIWHFARATLTRLTLDLGRDSDPLWTHDGTRVAFASDRQGGGVFWKAADGTGEVERLLEHPLAEPYAWTADGRLIFDTNGPDSGQGDLGVLAVEGDRMADTVLDTESVEARPALSPDGGWLAYASNESGQEEIYVRPFPNVDDGKWQVSTAGGASPVWSPDGQELFYRERNFLWRCRSIRSRTSRMTRPTACSASPATIFPARVGTTTSPPTGSGLSFSGLQGRDPARMRARRR